MNLSDRQLKIARALSRRDYEVRALFNAYLNGTIDQDGFSLLVEEIDGS